MGVCFARAVVMGRRAMGWAAMGRLAAGLACCVAAGPGMAAVLGPVEPEGQAAAAVRRGVARAAAAGLQDVQALGTPYTVRWRGRPLGAVVNGRGTDARLDGHEKTCFLAFVAPGAAEPAISLTSGRWPWARADCHGVIAIGALPDAVDGARIGVVYDGAIRGGTEIEPVVVRWGPGAMPAVDFAATRLVSDAGAETIAAMGAAIDAGTGAPRQAR